MPRLDNKTALITGATGGIGESTAERFLAEGANVMLAGRSAEKLEATLRRLGASPKLATCVADSHSETDNRNAVAATVRAFGGLDIVFANAGQEGKLVPIELTELADFEDVLRTNVLGVFLVIKHAIPALRQRGGGSIIVTASVAGMVGSPAMSPYIASKHAVNGLMKTAALELAADRIRVNSIAPGPIDNRMIRSLETQLGQGEAAAARALIEAKTALGRYGTNEEVANLALFLASDESTYCTGAVFPVDGGFTTS
jgi:NAD(P)-dependent dehydrogenase (short-subunit alcohol dehydrogenase family)